MSESSRQSPFNELREALCRADRQRDPTNEDSPLVRRTSSWMAGIAAAWIITESDRMVEVFEPYYR